MTTKPASLLPCVSAKAPAAVKSLAVASCVVKEPPSESVPVKNPFVDPVPLVLPVPDDEPPDVLPVPVDPVPEELPPLVDPVPDPVPPLDAPVPVTVCKVAQSSFRAIIWLPRYKVSEGFVSAFVTPKAANPGPTARMSTRRGMVPAMTNPTVVDPFAETVDRADTFSIGADDGISARPNRPVVVFVPETVVYVPALAPVNTRFVVVAGLLPDAGTERVAVLGPVTT